MKQLRALLLPLALVALALSALNPAFAPAAALLVAARCLHCTRFAPAGYLGVDPTDTLTDGGIQFGTQRTQIPTGGTMYVLEKISIRRPSERIVQKNEYGVPARKAHKKGLVEGTAVLQLPTATATAPAQHSVFALLNAPGPVGGGTPVNYILEEVGEEFEHEGETKVNITFSQKLV